MGKVTLTIKHENKGVPNTFNYVYKDGKFKVNGAFKDGGITMEGNAYRQDKGYVMEGNITMAGGREGFKVRLAGKWKVKK